MTFLVARDAKLDVSPSTVTNTLRRAGVPITRPGRPLTSV
jgi:hypothetical protein